MALQACVNLDFNCHNRQSLCQQKTTAIFMAVVYEAV
jgi:hypothetical protein